MTKRLVVLIFDFLMKSVAIQGLNKFDGNEQSRMRQPGGSGNGRHILESSSVNGYKPVRVVPSGFPRHGTNIHAVGMPRHSALSSSYSYTDGLSTSSLDRRATRNRLDFCI